MYVTFYKNTTPRLSQLTVEELLRNPWITMPAETYTPHIQKITAKVSNDFATTRVQRDLHQFMGFLHSLDAPPQKQYRHFTVRKASGKLRPIDEPSPDLKIYLKNAAYCLEKGMQYLPHDAAHAYVPKRCNETAMATHQKNKSNWYLHLDIKDFFPNHNKTFIMRQLEQVYPFGAMIMLAPNTTVPTFDKLIDHALLDNGKMPQGSPLSPLISNITMTPIDYEISERLKAERNHYIYTRYADDLIISCKVRFNPQTVVDIVTDVFDMFNAPFSLNLEKLKFSSTSGRNWHLGIMMNKENDMTIGHKNNQKLRAALFQFFQDNLTQTRSWSIMEVQALVGRVSYYQMIQPEKTEKYIRKYEEKFNTNFRELCKKLLNQY